MKRYCLGFIFDQHFKSVLLMQKLRSPVGLENMIGKLNGIGGKVEEGEMPYQAMIRECSEECGLDIKNWNYFLTLRARFGHVDCYYAVVSLDELKSFKQKEDEILNTYSITEASALTMMLRYYKNYPRMANLDWMIPMAINHYTRDDSVDSFIITEVYNAPIQP